MRLVFDTNALVSAIIIENSKTQEAYFRAIERGDLLLYSIETLAELQQVVKRNKFDKYLSIEKREKFVYDFMMMGELVEITNKIVACRDAKDDKFLELATTGREDYIITGDKDLLVMNPFRFVEIMTPTAIIQKINFRN